jgi:flavodoxin
MGKNILITYYSWSGNTGNIARLIQRETGGQLFELNPVQAYPRDYGACVEQAKSEIHTGFMPELKAIPENLDEYDVIFIGTPIWWYTMAPPVLTFLSNTDLSGKRVVPFCTHGGGGKGHYISDVSNLCSSSEVLEDLVVYENGGKSAAADISAWLKKIGIGESS